MKKTELKRVKSDKGGLQGKLTRKQIKELRGFLEPSAVLKMIDEAGWSFRNAVRMLVEIARTARPETRLKAIKYLNQLILDSLERSGLLVIASEIVSDEDKKRQLKLSGRLVSSIFRGGGDLTTIEDMLADSNASDEEKEGKEGKEQTDVSNGESGRESKTNEESEKESKEENEEKRKKGGTGKEEQHQPQTSPGHRFRFPAKDTLDDFPGIAAESGLDRSRDFFQ